MKEAANFLSSTGIFPSCFQKNQFICRSGGIPEASKMVLALANAAACRTV
ncbi:MAG: hypothetical protein ACTFAK_03315 [Candidatus Electronema sp. VV]